jgi:hypothetical protein
VQKRGDRTQLAAKRRPGGGADAVGHLVPRDPLQDRKDEELLPGKEQFRHRYAAAGEGREPPVDHDLRGEDAALVPEDRRVGRRGELDDGWSAVVEQNAVGAVEPSVGQLGLKAAPDARSTAQQSIEWSGDMRPLVWLCTAAHFRLRSGHRLK